MKTEQNSDIERSECCDAFVTYMDGGCDEDGNTYWVLCCKSCYKEIV